MFLKQLSLTGFRNYKKKDFDFGERLNVVWGKNASGKTNLLEAIYLLSLGESFRAKKIDEMVNFDEELGRVKGKILRENDEVKEIEVMVNRGEVGGKKVSKRRYLIEGVGKRKGDFLGELPVVLFWPEDMEILIGSPDKKRLFLDQVLIQTEQDYARSLMVYSQTLRRRNKLLDAIREGVSTRHALTFWNGLLIKHGEVLSKKREELVNHIDSLWQRSELFNKLSLVYDKSIVSEKRLEQYKKEELATGYTLVGPHKDDLQILSLNGEKRKRDLSIYGSRGEQRMAVLALKMGEIYFMEEKLKDKPLLLLDDIFSELDEKHKEEVLRVMKNRQVIATTADEGDVELFGKGKKLEL